jgi:ribosomal protein S27E
MYKCRDCGNAERFKAGVIFEVILNGDDQVVETYDRDLHTDVIDIQCDACGSEDVVDVEG